MMTHEEKILIMRAAECLRNYKTEYKAFKNKPIGAPFSDARRRQTIQIEIEDNAVQLIKKLTEIVNR